MKKELQESPSKTLQTVVHLCTRPAGMFARGVPMVIANQICATLPRCGHTHPSHITTTIAIWQGCSKAEWPKFTDEGSDVDSNPNAVNFCVQQPHPHPPPPVVFILCKKLTPNSSHLGVLNFSQALVTVLSRTIHIIFQNPMKILPHMLTLKKKGAPLTFFIKPHNLPVFSTLFSSLF